MALQLGVARRDVRVLRGDSSRRPRVGPDVPPQAVAAWLERAAGGTEGIKR